jgi:guanylate kinase
MTPAPPAPRRGIIFILSAPSGAGKTTLLRTVRERLGGLDDSVSYTTRPPRAGEQDGVDYHFLDEAAFRERVDRGFFAEWARVHRHLYGTSREDLQRIIERGQDAIMDIDIQGARQMKRAFPDAVTIFVIPPALGELEARLRRRGTEGEEAVRLRLETAERELEALPEYEYLIINDHLAKAAAELDAIIMAERLKARRRDPATILKAVRGA